MHYSVLQKEVLEALNIQEAGIYVDATVGYAGDAKEILKRIKRGFLFAFDADVNAVNYSNEVLAAIGSNYQIFNTNYANLKEKLEGKGIKEIDGIVFDLGLSSPQIDDASRGFSFMKDAPLDMRMSQTGMSAYDVVNNYTLANLIEIFFTYGEEAMSRKIAGLIVKKRENQKIATTLELVEVIKEAVGSNYFYKHHPERKIFQAIRIEVNQELEALKKALPDAIKMLKKGGRIVVITFHSLEDRIVKRVFKEFSEVDEMVKGLPKIPQEYQPLLKIVNKKAILPSQAELKENTRSNSAKMRVAERI